jgi:hypothetical protein
VPGPAEASRALRPGGTLITTVDKDDAHSVPDGGIARVTAEPRRRDAPRGSDHSRRVLRGRRAGAAVRGGAPAAHGPK